MAKKSGIFGNLLVWGLIGVAAWAVFKNKIGAAEGQPLPAPGDPNAAAGNIAARFGPV